MRVAINSTLCNPPNAFRASHCGSGNLPPRPGANPIMGMRPAVLATKEATVNIFFVGMKVVCVDDADPAKPFPYQMPNRPVCGCVYTVREIRINDAGEVGVWVHELFNPNWRPGRRHIFEPAFYAWRFRPLSESASSKGSLEMRPKEEVLR